MQPIMQLVALLGSCVTEGRCLQVRTLHRAVALLWVAERAELAFFPLPNRRLIILSLDRYLTQRRVIR